MRSLFLPSILQTALLLLTVSAAYSRNFQTKLENCTEFIGVASVPLAKVQSLVPAQYQIAVGPPGFASLVVRSSHCAKASIENGPNDTARVAQIGVVVIPPDGTGDVNSYLLSYGTDSLRLALRLEIAGWPVSVDPDLVYETLPDPPGAGGAFYSEISPLAGAGWFLSGQVTDPGGPSFPFVANWWVNGRHGRVKMSTAIPLLSYGGGTVDVHTRRQSVLGNIIGGNQSGFGTNLRGVFAAATMNVTLP